MRADYKAYPSGATITMDGLPETTEQDNDSSRLMNGHCTECGIEIDIGYLCGECNG